MNQLCLQTMINLLLSTSIVLQGAVNSENNSSLMENTFIGVIVLFIFNIYSQVSISQTVKGHREFDLSSSHFV